MRLSTHAYIYCGGWNVQIELFQGQESCITDLIDTFNGGKVLKWGQKNLGNCTYLEVNGYTTTFKIRCQSPNDFCPKYLYLELTNDFHFLSKRMKHWHDISDNEKTFESLTLWKKP